MEGILPSHLPLPETVPTIEVFDEVSLCGFPGDVVQGIDFLGLATTGEFHPRTTCMRGTVSSLRPFDPGVAATPENLQLIQYDLPVTPGTSGSAVLNASGQVIGVNFLRVGSGGDYTFAVRVDSLQQLLGWVASGALPGTDLASLVPHNVCNTLYYEPQYNFGFNPPAGWSGPTPDNGQYTLLQVKFEGIVAVNYFAVWASVKSTIWTNPQDWIIYEASVGATLVDYQEFTTVAGDRGYFLTLLQPTSALWIEAHIYKNGYDYQLFSPFLPNQPMSMYPIIEASLKTLCVGGASASTYRVAAPHTDDRVQQQRLEAEFTTRTALADRVQDRAR